MFPANAYVIREADATDDSALTRLAELDSQRPLSGRVLIGEIDGVPAAAVSLSDGRIVADPFQPSDRLAPLLSMRYRSLRAFEETPSLTARLSAATRSWRLAVRSAAAT